MLRRTLIAAALASFAVAPALGDASARQEKIKVLIVDGQNNHNWKAMTPFMKEQLERSGLFAVDVSTSPPPAAKDKKDEYKEAWAKWRPNFKDYKVVLSNYNSNPDHWPDEVNKSFEEFVKGGGGFLVIHAANNAFKGWKEYDQMIGLGWRDNKYGKRLFYNEKDDLVTAEPGDGLGAGHGAQHEYKIKIRDGEHPITKGMPKEWMHAADELYQGQRGPAEKMQILASAFADKDKAKGGPSSSGVSEPMLWVIPYGKGKVVTNVMGHENGKAVQCVGFITIMLRSCEWLATGKVTVPIPDNFPTADKVSVATK